MKKIYILIGIVLILFSSSVLADLTDNVTLWWSFDGNMTNKSYFFDSSLNGLNGSFYDMNTNNLADSSTIGTPCYVKGISNNSLEENVFNSCSTFYTKSLQNISRAVKQQFTYNLWVQSNDPTNFFTSCSQNNNVVSLLVSQMDTPSDNRFILGSIEATYN